MQASNHANNARVADFMRIMEQWAPAWTAESWDRVGLLAGSHQARAEKVWVALELSDELLDQALAQDVDLLLLHHPPIFKPLANLRTDHPHTARLIRAAAEGLALFAAHTNLDSAPGGVNDALGAKLGLTGLRPLLPLGQGLVKLVVFVPPEHLEPVAQAVFQAGGGRVGAYSQCAFKQEGEGSFLAPPRSHPHLGKPGEPGRVAEVRWETVLPQANAAKALAALAQAHPYEEPAFDLYPLQQGPKGFGLGRVGRLPEPMPGPDFLALAARRLGSGSPSWAGVMPESVDRVAILGGSGSEALAAAAHAGAQVFITGEAGHHEAEKARDLGLCLAVLGHYETEDVVVDPWVDRLKQETGALGLGCHIRAWPGGRSPWQPIKL